LQITDPSGNIIRQHKETKSTRALSPQTAALVTRLMQSVVEEGSAARLRTQYNLTMDIAGKTGTTQDQTDGWFIGFTPQLVTGVWVGGEHPQVRFRTLELGGGAVTALPVWAEYMKAVSQTKEFKEKGSSRFAALPAELEQKLNCASFAEERVVAETFIDRVIDNIFNVRNRSEEDKKKQEEEKMVKEQRKQDEKATREQKREERKKRREEKKRKRQSKD
jgi:penicillin-binding protein 1A